MPSVRGEDRDVRGGSAGGQRDAGELRRIDVDELRGREIAREQDAAGRNLEARRLRAIEREQHLPFEIEQIVDAFGQARIAGGVQASRAGAQARAPGEPALLPRGDGLARGVDEIRIVEQLEVRGHDFAHGRRARWSRAATRRARTASRARSNAAVSSRTPRPGFDDRNVRCL